LLSKLTPNQIVRNLQDVDLDDLAARGIRALLIDLDNTLCPWKSSDPSPACVDWVRRARERFGVCIVSNSVRPKRLRRVAEFLQIRSVGRWGLGRKPFSGGILAALRELEVEPSEAAMLGDQVMTDVLGGNRLGLYTVWVLPLEFSEFFGTKPSRLIEMMLMPRFRRLGLYPPAESEAG
jgi:HAD superfamily phosphatase (TIGR01668 family)